MKAFTYYLAVFLWLLVFIVGVVLLAPPILIGQVALKISEEIFEPILEALEGTP